MRRPEFDKGYPDGGAVSARYVRGGVVWQCGTHVTAAREQTARQGCCRHAVCGYPDYSDSGFSLVISRYSYKYIVDRHATFFTFFFFFFFGWSATLWALPAPGAIQQVPMQTSTENTRYVVEAGHRRAGSGSHCKPSSELPSLLCTICRRDFPCPILSSFFRSPSVG